MGLAGVGVTPDPSHWKSGVPVTPAGRVTEQVRVTDSPAMMGEEGEEEREIIRESTCEHCILTLLEYSAIKRNYIGTSDVSNVLLYL